MRLRIGLETKTSEKVKIAFGLASGAFAGSGDKNPTSTNYTFQGFNKAPIFIDYGYLQYSPFDFLTIAGGKVKNKMQVWNPSQLIWDNDINPDGISVNITKKIDEEIVFLGNLGWYTLNESKRGSKRPDVYILQPGLNYKIENFSAKIAVAYQQFNLKGKPFASNDTSNYLGTTSLTDYKCLNPSLEFTFKNIIDNYSLSIYGDYVKNSDDSYYKEALEGSFYGITFGDEKISEFGKWQFKFAKRRLEQNAIPFGLGDSDAYNGRPNTQGQIRKAMS